MSNLEIVRQLNRKEVTKKELAKLERTIRRRSTKMRTRMKAFVHNTVLFYRNNDRALDNYSQNCVYSKTSTSPGCAIGRFMTPKNAFIADTTGGNSINALINFNPYLFPKWMQDFDPIFLRHLQNLHDRNSSWIVRCEKRYLDDPGIIRVENILTNIDIGYYD